MTDLGPPPDAPPEDLSPNQRAGKLGAATIASWERGVCRACGAEARNPKAFYCDTHAPLRGLDLGAGPGRRRRGRPPKADKAPRTKRERPEPAAPSLTDQLEVSYRLLAQIWSVRDPVCAQVLDAQAAEMARSWENAPPRVRRALESVVGGAGWSAIIVAHAPLALAVYHHHVAGPRLEAQQRAYVIAQAEAAGITPEEWLARQTPAEEPGPATVGGDVGNVTFATHYGGPPSP